MTYIIMMSDSDSGSDKSETGILLLIIGAIITKYVELLPDIITIPIIGYLLIFLFKKSYRHKCIKKRYHALSSVIILIIIVIFFSCYHTPYNPSEDEKYFPEMFFDDYPEDFKQFRSISLYIPKDAELSNKKNTNQEKTGKKYNISSLYCIEYSGTDKTQIAFYNTTEDADKGKKYPNDGFVNKEIESFDVTDFIRYNASEIESYAWETYKNGNTSDTRYVHIMLTNKNTNQSIEVASTDEDVAIRMAKSVEFNSYFRSLINCILHRCGV